MESNICDKIVTFKVGKLAKEKGFPLLRTSAYSMFTKNNEPHYYNGHTSPRNVICTAPTQSLLQKWLRDKHKIKLFISKQLSSSWVWTIWAESASTHLDRYDTYEDALEEGLKEALKLIEIDE